MRLPIQAGLLTGALLAPALASTLASALAPTSLAAQTRFTAAFGATASTRLLHDQIVTGIDVQPRLAPTLNLRAGKELSPEYGVNAELGITTGGLSVRENGVSRDLGSIRTVSLTGGADGRFLLGTRWRVGVGVLKYFPSRHEGIFRQGGPAAILGGVGVDYRWSVHHQLEIVVGTRYDYHRFTTAELKTRGFFRTENVHRLAVSLGISWLKP
jgi:hypothetical protein